MKYSTRLSFHACVLFESMELPTGSCHHTMGFPTASARADDQANAWWKFGRVAFVASHQVFRPCVSYHAASRSEASTTTKSDLSAPHAVRNAPSFFASAATSRLPPLFERTSMLVAQPEPWRPILAF